MKLKIEITVGEKKYLVNLPGDEASIEQTFLENQPVHFGVVKASSSPLIAGGFNGDTELGGSCNVSKIEIIPHCNGTHTESVAHLRKGETSPFTLISQPLYPAILLTLKTRDSLGGESYETFEPGDLVITKINLEEALSRALSKARKRDMFFLNNGALLIRTLTNDLSKKTTSWEVDRKAPYFTQEAMGFISDLPIKHIIVDVPSLDRCHDGGRLLNHRYFFRDSSRTVTEMAFFHDRIPDGPCFVSISAPPFLTDAAPSRIVVYQAKEVT